MHADIKPRNIVRILGRYKLIDFDAAVTVSTQSVAEETVIKKTEGEREREKEREKERERKRERAGKREKRWGR